MATVKGPAGSIFTAEQHFPNIFVEISWKQISTSKCIPAFINNSSQVYRLVIYVHSRTDLLLNFVYILERLFQFLTFTACNIRME